MPRSLGRPLIVVEDATPVVSIPTDHGAEIEALAGSNPSFAAWQQNVGERCRKGVRNQFARETRVRDGAGGIRVIYTVTFSDSVQVPRCFHKTTRKTSKADNSLAASRIPGPGKGAAKLSEERFASVWNAIEDTPAEAENMKLRSELMIALKEQIERQGWTQGKPPAGSA